MGRLKARVVLPVVMALTSRIQRSHTVKVAAMPTQTVPETADTEGTVPLLPSPGAAAKAGRAETTAAWVVMAEMAGAQLRRLPESAATAQMPAAAAWVLTAAAMVVMQAMAMATVPEFHRSQRSLVAMAVPVGMAERASGRALAAAVMAAAAEMPETACSAALVVAGAMVAVQPRYPATEDRVTMVEPGAGVAATSAIQETAAREVREGRAAMVVMYSSATGMGGVLAMAERVALVHRPPRAARRVKAAMRRVPESMATMERRARPAPLRLSDVSGTRDRKSVCPVIFQ